MFFIHLKWALLWALFILILCGIPGNDIPSVSFLEILNFDKFVHASLFFVLYILTNNSFLKQNTYSLLVNKGKFVALVLCIIYGGYTEILQGVVFKERSADINDFIANSIGSVLALILYTKTVKIIRKVIVNF